MASTNLPKQPPGSDASYGDALKHWMTILGLSDRDVAGAVHINRTYPGKIQRGRKLPAPDLAEAIRQYLLKTARERGWDESPRLNESERRQMDQLLRTSFAREDRVRQRAKRPSAVLDRAEGRPDGKPSEDESEPMPLATAASASITPAPMQPTDGPAERPEFLAQSPRDQSGLLTEKTGRYHNAYESWQQQEAGVDVHPSPSLHNLPFQRNPFFTGQDQLLEQLHHRLTPGSQVTLSQAISGLGGIGKTELALEYVYRYHKDYSKVLWVSASREALLGHLILLLRDLGLELPSDKRDADGIVLAVRHWLSASGNWLLVLDNVDDLGLVTPTSTSFLPPSHHGAVLLTTQMQVTEPVALTLQMQPMADAAGALLLLRRTKRLLPDALFEAEATDDHPSQVSDYEHLQAVELARLLGGLPLAVDQAGAYILERATTIADYLSLYKQQRATLLQKRGSMPSAHPESVTTTFALAFERLQQKNAAAADLLRFCAFLGPDDIPESLIMAGDETCLGSVLAPVVSDPIAFDEAIEALRSLSLIQRNADTEELSMHRLVQAVLIEQMSASMQRNLLTRCLSLLDLAFPPRIVGGDVFVTRESAPELWWWEHLLDHIIRSTDWRREMESESAANESDLILACQYETPLTPKLIRALKEGAALNEKVVDYIQSRRDYDAPKPWLPSFPLLGPGETPWGAGWTEAGAEGRP